MTWQRVITLFIMVSASIVAEALGNKELSYMFAGAAAGMAVPNKDGEQPPPLPPRPRRRTLPPINNEKTDES